MKINEEQFEEEIIKKNQKTELIRSVILSWLKMFFIFAILTVIFWKSWNIFMVKELGVGCETRWWVFGYPTLLLFLILRLNSPYWKEMLKVFDLVIFGILIATYLTIISYFS